MRLAWLGLGFGLCGARARAGGGERRPFGGALRRGPDQFRGVRGGCALENEVGIGWLVDCSKQGRKRLTAWTIAKRSGGQVSMSSKE